MLIENKNEYSGVVAAVKAAIRRIVPLTPRMLANSICMLKSADSFVRNPDTNAPDKQANKCGTTYCEAVKPLEGCCFPHKTFVLIVILFTSPAYSILMWY